MDPCKSLFSVENFGSWPKDGTRHLRFASMPPESKGSRNVLVDLGNILTDPEKVGTAVLVLVFTLNLMKTKIYVILNNNIYLIQVCGNFFPQSNTLSPLPNFCYCF